MEANTIKKIKKDNQAFFDMIGQKLIENFKHDRIEIDSFSFKTSKKTKTIGGLKIGYFENKIECNVKHAGSINAFTGFLILNNNLKFYNLRILKEEVQAINGNSVIKDALLNTIKLIEMEELKESLNNTLNNKNAQAKKQIKI